MLAASNAANALVWIQVNDASQIKYQTWGDPGTGAGRIYIRNMSQFDSSALGCCYNYYIDLTTPDGKAIFPIFLSAVARGSSLRFAIPDGYAAGPIIGMGQW
jgi:hypothetical protein